MPHRSLFHYLSWRKPNPSATESDTPAGMWEVDLDLKYAHYGSTHWCRSWEEWLENLRRDRPRHVYLIADIAGERRVGQVIDAHELRQLPAASGCFPYLKYYRSVPGRSVAVTFALEALNCAAD